MLFILPQKKRKPNFKSQKKRKPNFKSYCRLWNAKDATIKLSLR